MSGSTLEAETDFGQAQLVIKLFQLKQFTVVWHNSRKFVDLIRSDLLCISS